MMKDVDSWLSHFFAENNDVLCLLAGVLLIIGAWKNWNWWGGARNLDLKIQAL